MSRRPRFAFVAAVAMVVAAVGLVGGCGSGDSGGLGKLVPVSGTVTLDGAPLANAAVSFRADESQGAASGRMPVGVTDANGRYELTTAERKGAPLGSYKVTLVATEQGSQMPVPGSEEMQAASSPIPEKYASPDTTDLSIEVKEGAPAGAYDLKLSK